jgi:protein TonB
VIQRSAVATLLASLAAHGGVVAVLFFLTSGESHPSVLFVDLEAIEERGTPGATAASGPAAGGGDTTRASSGSSRPAGREGGRSSTARQSPPAPVLSPPVPPSEPVREPEVAQAPTQDARQPEPAVAAVPARDAAPDLGPRSEPSPSQADPRANTGSSGERMASTSELGGGGRAALSSGASGAGPGGASAGTALGSGGPAGGAAGAEYGSYLAEVRRRILDALQYPPPARSRGLTGTVYLEIFIKSNGAIADVSVTGSSSHPLLDEAALEAVRGLAPQPFPKGLAPRPLRVRLPVVFDLQ